MEEKKLEELFCDSNGKSLHLLQLGFANREFRKSEVLTFSSETQNLFYMALVKGLDFVAAATFLGVNYDCRIISSL